MTYAETNLVHCVLMFPDINHTNCYHWLLQTGGVGVQCARRIEARANTGTDRWHIQWFTQQLERSNIREIQPGD